MRAASVLGLCAALLVTGTATSAAAFCRTTTCGPGQCTPSADCDYCLEGGKPLFWASRCVSFSVHQAGSPLRGIDFETARNTIAGSYARWMAVDCGGGNGPSLQVYDYGAVSCNRQEYNQRVGNSNIWMFRDDYWPYVGAASTLALTTITFNVKTGEIFDADVEVNSLQNSITVGDTGVQADLDSIVTHEAGHFLGLSHSCDTDATMYASYKVGQIGLRTLEPDDVAGICALFPPGSERPCSSEPRHGFSSDCCSPRSLCDRTQKDSSSCGAAATGAEGQSSPWWLLGALGLAAASLGRRRRR
ncbi:MAG: matrixin family metalloprotease [Polyangiaceae bacterium]|nr:matrixin family metalloprotease [Polyangiaceae bacterium]